MSLPSILIAAKKITEPLTIIYPSDDSYTASRSSWSNYWTSAFLYTTWLLVLWDYWKRRTFIKFNISLWIENPTQVKLWCYTNMSDWTSITDNVYPVTWADWLENTITWSNQPAIWATIWDIAFTQNTWAWHSIDITSLYNDWINLVQDNFWIAIWWDSTYSATSWYYAYMHSKEHTNSPYLELIA